MYFLFKEMVETWEDEDEEDRDFEEETIEVMNNILEEELLGDFDENDDEDDSDE
jgi:hypothetical protein